MIRVRFAPAPTGFLHIGGARKSIFRCLYARQEGGQVVLRIGGAAVERSAGAICSEENACSNACGVSEC